MNSFEILFDVSKFGFIEVFFTFFYLAMSCATYYFVRFFESKTKSTLDTQLSGIYVLLILPMLLNIFNLWCLSGFLIITENTKTLVSVVVGTIIVATGFYTLHKILKAIDLRELKPKSKISLKKEES